MTTQSTAIARDNSTRVDTAAKLAAMTDMARSIGQHKIQCVMHGMFDVGDVTCETTMRFVIEVLSETDQAIEHLTYSEFEVIAARNTRSKETQVFTWMRNATMWSKLYDAYVEAGAIDARPAPTRPDQDSATRLAHDEERFAAIDADLTGLICSWRNGFVGVASDATDQQPGWVYNFEPHLRWSILC